MSAPRPCAESARLEALRSYQVLDTPAEQSFDDLALLAAQICGTPIALVSLVDEERQWFKAKVGITATETSRDIAFCAHTILEPDTIFQVPDTRADARFADSTMVTSDPGVRFYAGAPLVAPGGEALGSLCVMDRSPRTLSPSQLAALRALSRQVVADLELRRQARELTNEAAERRRAEALLRRQFEELSERKQVADRHLSVAQQSRRALLSVIEDQKQSAQKLRASEDKFRKLAENINEVFWMTNADKSQMLYVSPAYERVWGRSCASLYARPETWRDAIHPGDRERIVALAPTKEARGEYDEEYRIVRPDGEERWIHDRAFPVRDQSGEVYHLVGIAEDVTRRKKLEEQFRQSQKMEGIGQLAGGVAHDFNNILAVIQMQAELLARGGTLSPAQAQYAEEIGNTVQRAAALTRQLLLFSRREVFQPRDMDLSEAIANTTKMLRRILGETVQMQLSLASQGVSIHADPGMMDQVLINLAVNARDAMPKGGHLVIETATVELDEAAAARLAHARPGSFARLRVSDTGNGIPAELLPRIFEPFFTTKDVGKGTGLGLATVFGIVQQHQGWVEVRSEVGHGTTFQIYFPQVLQRARASSERPSFEVIPGGTETILLVEDDPALRGAVRAALSHLGYRIVEAPTGVKALDVWRAERDAIRLLLTDLVMPDGMTGRELAQRILEDNAVLPVIYMSGYSAEVVGSELRLEEGTNFLSKPFQAHRLARMVRERLDARAKQQAH